MQVPAANALETNRFGAHLGPGPVGRICRCGPIARSAATLLRLRTGFGLDGVLPLVPVPSQRAPDEFTAAVALCLEQFLASRGLAGRVACEETTHRARGAKRPDVSVYGHSGQR